MRSLASVWTRVIVAVLFVVAAGVGGAIYQHAEVTDAKRHEALNLPVEFPLDIPLYKDFRVLDSSVGKIKDGRTQVKLRIQSDTPPAVLKDFYNDLLLKKGYIQRVYISIPTGDQLDMANEKYYIAMTFSKMHKDKHTVVDFNLFR
jgi:hypothetical protein